MAAEIRLHGSLALPESGPKIVTVDSGRPLLEILEELGLDGETFSILTINGKLVPAQAVPADGDEVDVFPPLCGGEGALSAGDPASGPRF